MKRVFLKRIFFSILQLEILQRQVTNLADSQSTVDDRTSRTKTEHAVLQARYHMLEEQLRDVCIGYLSSIVDDLNKILFCRLKCERMNALWRNRNGTKSC